MRSAWALAFLAASACQHVPAPASGSSGSSGPDLTTGDLASESSTATAVVADLGLASGLVVRGATVVGVGRVDLLVRDGRIVELGEITENVAEHDARGQFVAPAFIDSHVHLAYAFDEPTLAAGGIAAAVDLAAPLEFLEESHEPLALIAAGPMITALDGYPTQTWGAGGFGLEVDGVRAVRDAVDSLADAGAGVIKIPLGDEPSLTDDEIVALVGRAHDRGLKVVAHALGDAEARKAALLGVDMLAHTPVEPLTDETVEAWHSGAVISTLDAFGGSAVVVDNLRRLRAAGATVLYGTDLGNTGIPAIDPNEIGLLVAAGLDGEAIIAAGTATAAGVWGFEGLGTLAVGARASFLLLERDPRIDPLVLATPLSVYIDGELQPEPFTADGGIKGG